MSSPTTHSRLAVIGTVAFYMVAALSMVVANKWVLNTTDVPLFFLFFQLLIATLLFIVGHVFGLLKVPFDFNLELMKGLAPMIGLNVLSLTSSNFTLKYVDASFYQVARGLVLPFTVLTSYVFLSSRPSILILIACSIVTMGFLIGVFLDGVDVSSKGVFFGIFGSATTALHAVVIKRAIKLVDDSALKLGWYTNLLSAVGVAVLCLLIGEGPRVSELVMTASPGVLSTFLWGSFITGVLGFLMNIASLLSIKVTSPITHMVSSAVRGVAASILGVLIFKDVIGIERAASIAIIVFGSGYYTWIKHVESQEASNSTELRERDGVEYARVPKDDLEAGGKGENDVHEKPE